ncbi:MAG: PEP-CTERM sorting domain-containing protein [Scytonematopsis contorta HA4267-MV1]|jgi:hypothetical protein|nr:PEP-CTERM sorting domain-containing protein [Scytonematopsis contorta HA4267-MV1]
MKEINKILLSALAISLCFSEVSQARIITSISPPTGNGLGEVLCPQVQTNVDTPFPNNDNSIAPSQNQISSFPGLSCTPAKFQSIAPIYTQLFVKPSGGTTEYFLKQTVVNNTKSIWKGFNFKIGFGINNEFAPPELILVPQGFAIPSFDFKPLSSDTKPTSSKFTLLIQDGSFSLDWLGGSVAPGESVDFTFALDTPDDIAGNDFYQSFTIRQAPNPIAVPEANFAYLYISILGVFASCKVFKVAIRR